MAKNKVYAVKKGLVPGIYYTWDECKANVDGYPGAKYKSFKTVQEADAFMRGSEPVKQADNALPVVNLPKPEKVVSELAVAPKGPYAFVDGSFNAKTGVYGYGGFLVDDKGERHMLYGSGHDTEMASMRNVAGEIKGSEAAIKKAQELGLKKISMYYDYMGIEQWANGGWKTNKSGTYAYAQTVADARAAGLDIDFVKVEAHTGVPGNELADKLAKQAVGILPMQRSYEPKVDTASVSKDMQFE